ncbi:MAG: siphovirus ReqiPepy6 Gp37-like family protein [Clostridiales bacterium]|nr:siphovirus ReqiPepy6 Gp37-like family protein [Clostridiales bacterium]
MQLLILDENLDILGPVSIFTTLIWTRRYQGLGAFELYTSKDYFQLLNSGRYLYRSDADELGVIREVCYEQSDDGSRSVYAKGNFAECLLYDRIIDGTVTLSGNLETVMRSLVTKFCISPSDSDRVIKRLSLGDTAGLTATVDSQVTGENLSDELYALGNVEGYSHRIRYDFAANILYFEVWQGKDRRDSQTENSWAIFSNAFYNIKNATYTRDESSYRNFAYIAGEENEDGARTVVEVDLRSDTGETRRELYVDARDLQSEDEDGNTLGASEYEAQLVARGQEKLAEYQKSESVSSAVDAQGNLIYKEDYDLGDYCTYVNTEIGVEMEQQITEIQETYEGAAMSLSITLGNDGVSTIQQLIRREA